MASLWPFLRKLDPTIEETFLGWVNAGYSFAQMIASVLMGYWSEKRNAKEPMHMSILLLALGSGLYSYAEAFGRNGVWILLLARVLLGLSAGVVGVARAVGSQLSSNEDRSSVMANLALWQAIGFSFGPILQALAKPVGSKGLEVDSIKLYVNVYTVPGFLMIIAAIANFIVVLLYFNENLDNSKEKFHQEVRKLRRESTSFEPLDFTMIVVCQILWFFAMTVFSLNETILSPLVMNEYGWTRNETVFYTSILLAAAGVVAILCFLGVVPLEKKLGGRGVVFIGFFIMLLGFISYLPWGPGNHKLSMAGLKFANGTALSGDASNDIGCPYQYNWCRDQPVLPFGQFINAATLVGIGYPIVAVLISTLYSKIIGPFPQGKYQGWLSGIGSLARVVGPIYVTFIYTHTGMRWTATSICGMLSFTLILVIVFWRRLVPYDERPKLRTLSYPKV